MADLIDPERHAPRYSRELNRRASRSGTGWRAGRGPGSSTGPCAPRSATACGCSPASGSSASSSGDDAGSPVLAQMRDDHTRLTKAKLGEDPVEPMVDPLPLEARVERLRRRVRARRAQDRASTCGC